MSWVKRDARAATVASALPSGPAFPGLPRVRESSEDYVPRLPERLRRIAWAFLGWLKEF